MERAEAKRLQPHFIASFFREAFTQLGGTLRERESKRYEIRNVPAIIRKRDVAIGVGTPVLKQYERITFEKDYITVPGKPLAEFVCPAKKIRAIRVIRDNPRFRQRMTKTLHAQYHFLVKSFGASICLTLLSLCDNLCLL